MGNYLISDIKQLRGTKYFYGEIQILARAIVNSMTPAYDDDPEMKLVQLGVAQGRVRKYYPTSEEFLTACSLLLHVTGGVAAIRLWLNNTWSWSPYTPEMWPLTMLGSHGGSYPWLILTWESEDAPGM